MMTDSPTFILLFSNVSRQSLKEQQVFIFQDLMASWNEEKEKKLKFWYYMLVLVALMHKPGILRKDKLLFVLYCLVY